MPNLAPAAPATPTYDGVAPLTEEQNAALSEDSDEDEEDDLMFLDDDAEAHRVDITHCMQQYIVAVRLNCHTP